MNDYLSRGEIAPVDRGTSRPMAVAAVQPISGSASARQNGRSHGNLAGDEPGQENGIASLAEYARVHERIAEILSELRAPASRISVDAAAEEIQALLPTPMVIVPLPPVPKEAVESAIRIARRLAERAGLAHVAQANLRSGTADQLLSAGT